MPASVQNIRAMVRDVGFLRALRKAMGLGDTLGALPSECGGTGVTSVDDLCRVVDSRGIGRKAVIPVAARISKSTLDEDLRGWADVSQPDLPSWLGLGQDGALTFSDCGIYVFAYDLSGRFLSGVESSSHDVTFRVGFHGGSASLSKVVASVLVARSPSAASSSSGDPSAVSGATEVVDMASTDSTFNGLFVYAGASMCPDVSESSGWDYEVEVSGEMTVFTDDMNV